MTGYKIYLIRLNKNLQILKERRAKHAGNAPPELINQIEDHRQAIALTEQAQAGELGQAEWREVMRSLLIQIEDRTGEAAIDISGGQIGVVGDYAIIEGDVHFYNYSAAPPPPVAEETLAAALARLDELPLDHIPDPAPALPPGSRMPFRQNLLFVEREEDLKQLARTLKGHMGARGEGL